jgi:uncharacterized protein YgbK (DUF1537 family)
MQRLVIADDLTGASDAGLQFAKRGLRTTVWLDRQPTLRAIDADVVVVDTDARAATAEDAFWRLKTLLGRVRPLTPNRVFKKIDSTLRGHIGAEVRALFDALPDALAIVCPALPKQGRTCRDGTLFVHGVRVDETSVARDPLSPVSDARVAAHLDAPAASLTLAQLRSGAESLYDTVEYVRAHGIRIIVADAETDDDLRALAALQRDDVLWVGSSGLMEYIADHAASGHPELASRHPELGEGCAATVPSATGPVVFIVGSPGEVTQRQIEVFAAQPGLDTQLVDAVELVEGSSEVARKAASAAAAVIGGFDTMIAIDREGDGMARALTAGQGRDWDARRTTRCISDNLVAMADAAVNSDGGGTVVLSGGDVARAFCERRGIQGLELIAEVAPGIPISRAIGANLYVVTKAGGFGHPNTYVDIATALHAKAVT